MQEGMPVDRPEQALYDAVDHYLRIAADPDWHQPGSTAPIRAASEYSGGHRKLSHSPAAANLDVADFLRDTGELALALEAQLAAQVDGQPTPAAAGEDGSDLRPARRRNAAFTRLAAADRDARAAWAALAAADRALTAAQLELECEPWMAHSPAAEQRVLLAGQARARAHRAYRLARQHRDELAAHWTVDATASALRHLAAAWPALGDSLAGDSLDLAGQIVDTVDRMTRETRPTKPIADCPFCACRTVLLDPHNEDVARCVNRRCRTPEGQPRAWSKRAGEWAIFGWDRAGDPARAAAISADTSPAAG